MNNGGIFNGPTALGYLGLGEGTSAKPCQGVSFFTELQAELKRRGYSVRQDGIWDGCCQSAIIKELGAPLTTVGQVQGFLGHGCSSGYMELTGALLPGPMHTVPPTCADGSDKKGSQPGTMPSCPPGQIYDLNLQSCVPTADPYGCGTKCGQFSALSAEWAKCLLECNVAGGNVPTPLPPGPGPSDIVPTTPAEPGPASVLGDNLPLILGALAVGLTAAVYFGTRPKKTTTALARSNRRRRNRKSGKKGRR